MAFLIEILKKFLRETEPSFFTIIRLKRHLYEDMVPPEEITKYLRYLPAPLEGAEERIKERLKGLQIKRRPRLIWIAPAAIAAAGLAAILIFNIEKHKGEEKVSIPLDSIDLWTETSPWDAVSVEYKGTGHLSGTSSYPEIRWEAGTLTVKVEPEKGVNLLVATDEAEIRVTGTAFNVTRNALGTEVMVHHGSVSVLCRNSEKYNLGAGERAVCLPLTAAGLLARARALEDAGAPSSAILKTVNFGLSMESSNAVRGELLVVKIQTLFGLRKFEEALAAADEYFSLGHTTRLVEVLGLAADMAWSLGGCSRAMKYLSMLVEKDPASPASTQYWDCMSVMNKRSAKAENNHPVNYGNLRKENEISSPE